MGLLLGVKLFDVLHAFASGGAAVTGVEAISNGVPAFRKPAWRNARQTLVIMGTGLGVMFLGISALAAAIHVTPFENGSPTVIAQIGEAVFGHGALGDALFYSLQAGTMLILVMAANTGFADFPRLASFQAGDSFLPRQLTKRGHRLVYSNGIIALAAAAGFLVIVTGAEVTRLIPLYAIGVFTGFTLSQSGMTKHHIRKREQGWRKGVVINGFGAILSGLVAIIIATTKFSGGGLGHPHRAAGPGHRLPAAQPPVRAGGQDHLEVDVPAAATAPILRRHVVLVFVDRLDLASARAIQYARTLTPDELRAVHFVVDDDAARHLADEWSRLGLQWVPLELVECPDRRLTRTAVTTVARELSDGETEVSVLLPDRKFRGLWHRILHDRTAEAIQEEVSRPAPRQRHLGAVPLRHHRRRPGAAVGPGGGGRSGAVRRPGRGSEGARPTSPPSPRPAATEGGRARPRLLRPSPRCATATGCGSAAGSAPCGWCPSTPRRSWSWCWTTAPPPCRWSSSAGAAWRAWMSAPAWWSRARWACTATAWPCSTRPTSCRGCRAKVIATAAGGAVAVLVDALRGGARAWAKWGRGRPRRRRALAPGGGRQGQEDQADVVDQPALGGQRSGRWCSDHQVEGSAPGVCGGPGGRTAAVHSRPWRSRASTCRASGTGWRSRSTTTSPPAAPRGDDPGRARVVMTMRGRRSGNVRKAAVMRVEHDGTYAAVASKGGSPEHPGWYHNLLAHPDITLQDGTEATQRAREVRGRGGREGRLVGPRRRGLAGLRRLPEAHRPPHPRGAARTRRHEFRPAPEVGVLRVLADELGDVPARATMRWPRAPGVVEGGPDQLGAQPSPRRWARFRCGERWPRRRRGGSRPRPSRCRPPPARSGRLGVVAHGAGHAGPTAMSEGGVELVGQALGRPLVPRVGEQLVRGSSTSTAPKRTSTMGWPS